MSAKPLSRRDLHNLYVSRVGMRKGQEIVELDADDWDRVWATLQHGELAPEEPTPYELDKWAAEKIMGWTLSANTWVKAVDDGSLMGTLNVINRRDWKPTVNLGQALECVKEAGHSCQGVVHRDGRLMAYVDGLPVHQDASNTAELAEAIVRKLHEEVGE